MTWVFIFSAVAFGQGVAFSVGFQSEEACRSYATAYVSRPATRGVRTAECIGLRNGKVVDVKK